MRRILMVLSVTAIMLAMMVASAGPVFADSAKCTRGGPCHSTETNQQFNPPDPYVPRGGSQTLHETSNTTPGGTTTVFTQGGSYPAHLPGSSNGGESVHCSLKGCQGSIYH